MAKTISIDEIRRRKGLLETTDGAPKSDAPVSSPFSYIILLEEEDSAPALPRSKKNTAQQVNND